MKERGNKEWTRANDADGSSEATDQVQAGLDRFTCHRTPSKFASSQTDSRCLLLGWTAQLTEVHIGHAEMSWRYSLQDRRASPIYAKAESSLSYS